MKKRLFSLLMALCLVVSLLPAQIVTAEGTDGETTPVVASEDTEGETTPVVASEGGEDEAALEVENEDSEKTPAADGENVPEDTTEPVETASVEASYVYWYIAANGEFLSHSTVEVGKTLELELCASDDSAVPEDIVWSVSDETKASITGNGAKATVTGLAGGVIDVSAKSASTSVGASSTTVYVVDENTTWGFGLQDFDGTFTVSRNGSVLQKDTSVYGMNDIAAGNTLESAGYQISDLAHPDPEAEFMGWEACIVNNGAKPIEGVGLLSTQEMLKFPARSDDTVTFYAVWKTPVRLAMGSNLVKLPANDSVAAYVTPANDGVYGTYLFYVENGYKDWELSVPGEGLTAFPHVTATAFGYSLWLYGQAAEQELVLTNTGSEEIYMEMYVAKAVDATDVIIDGVEYYGNVGETKRAQVLSATSTGRVGDVEWSVEGPAEITQDDYDPSVAEVYYKEAGVVTITATGESFTKSVTVDVVDPSGGDYPGGEENFVPEGETLTVVTLNQKYAVAPEKDSYFTFTAPKTGYYAFHSDNQYDTFCYNYWSAMWINCQIGYAVITLQEGQEYTIAVSGDEGYNIWFTETVGITDLEILKQDTSKVFPRSNGVYWESLWEGMTVKATFSDGTTKTYELNNDTYDLDGFEIYLDYDLESAGDTATVTMYCGDGEASFIVNVEKEYVTDFEVISETPVIEVTENTMGWFSVDEESGESYYVYYAERFVNEKAKFLFTWSDGTQEEVTFDPYEFPHMYHGIHMEYYWCEVVQHEDHWSVGNTYTFDMVYGEFTVPVQVKIVESPVQKVEVLTQMTELLGEPAFELYEGAWHLIDPDWSKLEIRLTMKDGTAKTYTFEDWVFADDGVYLDEFPMELYPNEASEEGLTGPGKYYVDLVVGGKMTTFYVEGVEKIVADNTVTVAPSVMEEQLGASTEIKVEATEAPVVNLPAASVDKVAATNADLKISLNNAQVTISQAAMDTIASKTAGQAEEVILSVQPVDESALSAAQKALIDDVKAETETGAAVVLDITLEVDGVAVTSFGGQITVRIPFTAPAGTNGSDFAVYYLSEDGKTVQKMPTTYADGYLTFVTDHFSDYVALNADPEGTVVYTPATGSTAGGNGGVAGTVKPGAPATGDNAPVVGLIVMLCCSGLMAAAFLTLRKKFRV